MVSDEAMHKMKGEGEIPFGYGPSGPSSIAYSNGQISFRSCDYEKSYFGITMARNYSLSYAPTIARSYGQSKEYERRKIYSLD